MADQDRKLIGVAGGTDGIGRPIFDGIISTKKYSVKVFTRQDPSSASDLTAKGVNVVKVDYFDHGSLVKELNGVHTVISCILPIDDSSIQSQFNLLDACLEVGVKCFAPSEFSSDSGPNTII